MSKRLPWLAILMAVMLALAVACGDDDDDNGDDGDAGGETTEAPASDLSFHVISHGGPGDAFWDVVKNGAEAAGSDLGVGVTYQADPDAQAQSQLIDAAVADGTNGVAVSMANPDALEASITAAIDAGVPVVTINSGVDRFKEFGAITHVGQTELVAGQGAGEQLKDAGVTKLLCVIHEAGNIGLEERCQGASETLGGTVENLQVDGADLAEVIATVRSALQADSEVDGVLTLNPGVAISARDAISEAGSDVTLATFDLSGDVVEAIQGDEILFAIDQQQYLQGYIPIVILKLFNENANTLGGGLPVLTGPGFVTKENAGEVADLAASGTR